MWCLIALITSYFVHTAPCVILFVISRRLLRSSDFGSVVSSYFFVFFFFFFQAEDGIRDTSVTGVQTCALPILIPAYRARAHVRLTNKTPCGTYRAPGRYESSFARERLIDAIAARLDLDPLRSEERRVGKECRCRGSPEHEKRNKESRGRQRKEE